jgi:3-oxocholest-4-en-26-oate---CoA ligase
VSASTHQGLLERAVAPMSCSQLTSSIRRFILIVPTSRYGEDSGPTRLTDRCASVLGGDESLEGVSVANWAFADIWENVAETLPESLALVHGGVRRSWSEFDRRADSLAQFLLDDGCGYQEKVAFYLYNGPEYMEAFAACSKASLVPVNTNYRYADDELVYLWTDADVVCVVFHGVFGDTIERLRSRVPGVRTWLWVDDGSGDCPAWAISYDDAVRAPAAGHVRGSRGRSGDDLVLLYTGGTTGLPKGVMWRQGDLVALLDRTSRPPLPLEPDLDSAGRSRSVRVRAGVLGLITLVACPLIHGTGMLNAGNTLSQGGSVVTLAGRHFDAGALLDTVDAEGVKGVVIVGDAFARPILRALEENPGRWSLSSLRLMLSSGVMWSSETKQGLSRRIPRLIMVDGFGSSEAIGMGESVSRRDKPVSTATFALGRDAIVLTEDGQLVNPGSGEIGRIGVRGHAPIGYYKDSEKSAATFPVIDGVRYSLPGDFATVEADGTITLLGRGSLCINTAGEKVFPEEVEEVLKTHPSVRDAIVVGIPDDRLGQAVTAVVETETGDHFDENAMIAHVKARLARYKAPRKILVVDSLGRAANGKADYRLWTERAAAAGGPT